MFEFVRTHTRLFQFVLVLLIFPSFVFFGIQGYSSFSSSNKTVAKVAGQAITQAEWDAAHRQQLERMRAQAPGVDLKALDTPEMKQQTLEALVRERVMVVAADKLHLVTGDERLARSFASDPQLAFLRKPDGNLNTELLKAQGLSAEQFERQLRQDLAMRQVLAGVSGSAVGPRTATDAALDALLQRREVRVKRFDTKDYVAKAKPSDAEVKAYYDDPARLTDFQAPERASIEYVVLDIESLKAGITVKDDELRQQYEANASRYGNPEERRASHILIAVKKSASAADREKAKAKAQSVLAEAKKAPGKFAELAKKNSDDPSAAQGGDLDWFGRDAMVKPFADAAFALKAGQLSEVVETEFGYHVILVTGVRGGDKKPFEAAKPEIEAELKQQQAQRRYTEAAETFNNMVYEQSDSLKPVAEKLGLKIQTATAVTRIAAQGATGALGNPKFLNALFGDEVVRNKRNTEAVEIGPNQLAAGRIVNYAPARKLPFDEVKELVRLRVQAEQAAAMARKEGAERLKALRGGGAPDGLQPAVTVSRNQTQNLPQALVDAILQAPTAKLPQVVGVELGAEGYALARIEKLLPRDATGTDPQRLQSQYAQVWGAAETEAYYAALKQRFKASIDPEATLPPADQGASR